MPPIPPPYFSFVALGRARALAITEGPAADSGSVVTVPANGPEPRQLWLIDVLGEKWWVE